MKLSAGRVHIWQVNLDGREWDFLSYALSQNELEKVRRFRGEKLQRRFARCRGALRWLLSCYTELAPRDQVLYYDRFGKPSLADSPIFFNVSHSGNRALIAVSQHIVGIDVEQMNRHGVDISGIVKLVCHPAELAEFERVANDLQAAFFYRLWTRKEAYVKALGSGLQHPLPQVRFGSTPAPGTSFVVDESTNNKRNFFVYDLESANEYAASLCIEAENAELSYFSADSIQHDMKTNMPVTSARL